MHLRPTVRLAAVALPLLCVPFIAAATETVTYTYDAQGRLVKVVSTGTINNNVQTTYTHDNADNRTNVKVEGAPS